MGKRISWVDVSGTEYPLNSEFTILLGTSGFYMPPFEYTEELVPFQYGSRLRNIQVLPREIDVPLKISAKSELELERNLRTLLRMFNPLKGDGKFVSVSHDDNQREVSCRYVEGLEMDEDYDTKGKNWQKAIAVFRAFDPFWYDAQTIVHTFNTGQLTPFFPLTFPIRLNSSAVFADTTIENTGDIETYPEWIITGPGENITLRNLTTGEVLQSSATLGVGESLTINTRPFHKSVTRNDGTNLFYTLSDDSSLWALTDGQNAIRLEMAGATDQSGIQLSYKNRYWGP
jgi:hypothetical protein